MGIYRTNDPTQFDDVDGIIIDESAPAPNVQGVAANVAALVAKFQRGPAELTQIGSIGQLHELYGKSSFSGNLALRNKAFGLLKLKRVIASDAAKATLTVDSKIKFDAKYEGDYGNLITVKLENAGEDVNQVTSVTCVADSSDSLDGKTFILADKDGTVAFWIDTDDSGTTIPAEASAADRAVEITTIVTDDDAETVAGKVQAAVDADSQFSATVDGAVVTVTDAAPGTRSGTSGSTSGFTLAVTTAGEEAGVKYTISDTNPDKVLGDEIYDNLKIADIDDQTFAGSQLVDVTVLSTTAEPALQAATPLATGSDGTISDTDYEAALQDIAVDRAANFVFLDEYNSIRNGYLKTHAAFTQDRMVILAGPEEQTVSEVIQDVKNYRDGDGRIIYAYPWVKTTINAIPTFVNPASFYASILSQTSPHIDPAFSGNTQFLGGMTALKRSLTRSDYIQLKDAGVSAFENDADIGFKVKSGIVTQIANSSKVTVLRRRMADFLTNSVALFLKNYQNAPNTRTNRDQVKAAILGFDDGLINDGILPGDAEVNDGKARIIDTESLNTDLSIGLGFFKIQYKRRIYSSMRFIVLQAEIGETVVVTET